MMSVSYPLSLLLLTLCFANSLKSCYSIILCPEIEKQALISFKQTLQDPYNRLSSWNLLDEDNCCNWKGVACNNITGHVRQLHLGSNYFRGRINRSLLHLKQLEHLDLSQNRFEETFPSFIGSFTKLEYLDLSNAGFHGRIPHTIGNLSALRSLSLKTDYKGVIHADNLEWLSGLSRLERLNMNRVNLTGVRNWAQVIGALPSLFELSFRTCSLNHVAPLAHANSSSLANLDLSSNNFEPVAIPGWIFQLSKLLFLDLRSNRFEGPISNAVGNLTFLTSLNLVNNKLSGKIPREIASLCWMQELILSLNELEGEISDSFGNMSNCFLSGLEILNLRKNRLSGQITDQFGEFKNLKKLALGGNNLKGNLPASLGQLLSLEVLEIGENILEGVATEIHFANLTKLKHLEASGNRIQMKVSANWIPPFRLEILGLGSWSLGTNARFPPWIKTQKDSLWNLDLSDTGMSGNLPIWAFEILILDLSNNNLNGNIPEIDSKVDSLSQIYLSSNRFTGSLPRVANDVSILDISNNSVSGSLSNFLCDTGGIRIMYNLHLGRNEFTGELPDCWMKWPNLLYLNLGNNKLSGSIPNSIGYLRNLVSFSLYGNNLSGQIPSSMQNCTALMKVDFSGNYLNGNIPTWMGTSFRNLWILILRSNKMSGEISSDICRFNWLQILDLSDNNFAGEVPTCVDGFTAMSVKTELAAYPRIRYLSPGISDGAYVATKGRKAQYDGTILRLVINIDLSNNNLSGEIPKELTSLVELQSLNLSGNQLTGLIPDGIGDMKKLESLDLSRNSLSGGIPDSLTTMSFLSDLNVSYNNLTGKIPESTQVSGMDASRFIGNDLCGQPLPKKCNKDDDDVPLKKEDDKEEEFEMDWLFVFLSLGYAVGFSAFCTTLVLKKSWRKSYFGMIERMWDRICGVCSVKK